MKHFEKNQNRPIKKTCDAKLLLSRKYTILLLLSIYLSINAFAQTTETFVTGSYIINMGIVPQTQANVLKPYGLIYDLLQNNFVPIKWVINEAKAKDGIDFTYNGVQYKGGTIIIPGEFRNAAVNAKIISYGVAGTTTTTPLTLPVTSTLTSAPRWTLDSKNGSIAQPFFTQAGIPTTSYNWKDPQVLANCDDIFVMPHADPTWATHSNLYTWNRTNFGAIWAGCHAVSVLENMNNGTLQTNFLATNVGLVGNALVPFGSHADGTPPYIHQNAGEIGAQYMGISDDAHLNGSEQIYLPKLGGGWRPATKVIAYDPTQANVPGLSPGAAAVIVTGRGFGLSTSGWVMYEGGHDITKAGGTASIAAIRAFFDFSFQATADKVPMITASSIPASLTTDVVYPLSVTATSPVGVSITYAWTSTCGGTFSNPTGSTTNFTAPTVATAIPCIIHCVVTDACGRKTFYCQTVTIYPAPKPPVALTDAATINSNCGVSSPLTKNIIANDISPDGRPLTLTSITPNGALNGTMTFTAAGDVTFTPNAGFLGSQIFDYTVCDNLTPTPLCANSNYIIAVGSGTVPITAMDNITIDEDAIATINVLANDETGLTVVGIPTAPTNGKVSINIDGTITYIPNADYAGADKFTYKVKNAAGNFATQMVNITVVNNVCDAGTYQNAASSSAVVTIVADADTYHDEDGSKSSKNNGSCVTFDVDGEAGKRARSLLTFRNLSSIPSGAIVTSATLRLNLTTAVGITNIVSVHGVTQAWTPGTLCNAGGTPNWLTTFAAVPANPTFNATPLASTSINTTLGDKDWTSPSLATLVGNWKTTPTSNLGLLLKSDNEAESNSTLKTFASSENTTIANRPRLIVNYTIPAICLAIPARAPLSMPDDAATLSNTAATISVLTNDNFVTSPTVTISTVPALVQGTAVVSGSNIVFTPNPMFNGLATFQYTVTTANGSDVAVVYVQVTNSPVVANNDNPAGANSGITQTINVKANDVDPEMASLMVTIVSGPANGTATVNASGNIVYVPAIGFSGNDVVTYKVCEPLPSCGSPYCSTALLTLTVLNQPPVANSDIKSINICSSATIDLLTNDTDPEGGILSVTNVSALSNLMAGTLVNNNDGTVTFTAGTGFVGSVSFTYNIKDDGVPAATAGPTTVTINVANPINTAPVAVNDTETTNVNQVLYANVRDNDLDPENNILTTPTITVAPTNGTATVNPINGLIEYIPNINFYGTDVLTYRICDIVSTSLVSCSPSPDKCATATLSITVLPPPVQPITESVTVSSSTGGTLPNIVSNDKINGLPATLGASGNSTIATVGTWPIGISLNPLTGVVSIVIGITPGIYPITYKLCDKLTPQTCLDMVDSITITPSIQPAPENGVTVSSSVGGTIPNIASNDMVNGLTANLSVSGNATVARVGAWPTGITLDSLTGIITIAVGTTPGTYPVTYKLCDKLTPQTCTDMVDNITVTPSIQPVTESVSVSSATGGILPNIVINDKVNGLPATLGASGNATIATVGIWPTGITLDPLTGIITIAVGTPPGSYPITYKLCDKLIPQTCINMVDNITVTPAVQPVTESVSVSSSTGGTMPNIVNNDKVNGVPATLGATGNSTVATVGTWLAGITLDPLTGVVTIVAGTPPGNYPVTYKLCDKLTPQTCMDVVDNIIVTGSIVPVTESVTISSATGGIMPNIAANDKVNGLSATSGATGNSTIATVGTWPTGIILDQLTGVVTIAVGTPPGNYPVTYKLCDKATPPNCLDVVDYITVTPSIQPITEGVTVSSATGGTLPNIAINDKVNGISATLGVSGNATVATVGTWPTGITLDPLTGVVTIAVGTPPGIYPVTYKLCDKLTPQNCMDMVDNITVTPSIQPVTESVSISSATGGILPNIAINDKVNGLPATLGASGNATVATVGTWPTGIILDPLTGVVSIAAGTAPATYPITYKLCDKLTPQNCIDMVDFITVTPSIQPVTESVSVSSATGGILPNIASNDKVNGVPVTLGASGNATIATVGIWPTGITLDPLTGVVTIAAGTAPAIYPITYKLCDKLTPQNCMDMVDNITVTPSILPVTESITVSSSTGGTMPNIAINDKVNGIPVTLGASGNATVAAVGTWPAGISLDPLTGVVTIAVGTPPAIYPVTYKLCDKLTPQNCMDMVDNITVTPSILPVTESITVSSSTGGTMPNIAINDKVNGLPATLGANSNATVAAVGTWPTGISLNPLTGVVTIAVGTLPGNYPITYMLCDKLTPQNCMDIVDNITVTPSIQSVTESVTVPSATGGTMPNIATNDKVNGLPATLGVSGNATVSTVGTWPTGITLDPLTGVVTIVAGTPPGNYPVTYKLCDKATPINCMDMVDNIVVTSSILPVTESITVPSSTGGTMPNIAINDKVNGAPATLGVSGNATVSVVGTWPTGITLDPLTGVVTIAAGTAPGNYPITYKLCDKATPINCMDMVDNITVTPSIQPVTESVSVSSATGGILPNIAINDKVNGVPATLGVSGNATVATVGTWPTGITLDPLTGVVSIAAGTAPATYPITYKLCDKLTPQNCMDMVDNIMVTKPAIKLVKTASLAGTGVVGDVITYTFTVTNTGNISLTATSISDPKLGLTALAVTPSSLAPLEIGIATATYTITQADLNAGEIINTAIVTGTPPSGGVVTDVSDSGNEFVDTPVDTDTDPTNDPTVVALAPISAIKLVKTGILAGPGAVGDIITFTFTVTNTGNVPLTGLSISDPKLGLTALAVTPSNLAPLGTGTVSAAYTITQADLNAGKVLNTAVVSGTPPNGVVVTDVSDSGDELVDSLEDPDIDPTNDPTVISLTPTPSIKLVKIASLIGTGNAGSTIVYTFTVTNTGNVPLTALSISDPKLGLTALTVTPSSLAPNAQGTATASYIVTQADINTGKIVNTAIATGTPPNGVTVTDVSDSGDELVDTPEDADTNPTNDPTAVSLTQTPAVKLVKIASLAGTGVVGDVVTYTFTITNTGNMPLTALSISDPKLGLTALAVTPSNLAPLEMGTAIATYTITQADINTGKIVNTATVTGMTPNGGTITDVSDSGNELVDTNADPDNDPTNDPTVVPLTPTPAIKLVKTASLAGIGIVGDIITYTFKITNIGNTTLNTISISDSKLGLTALVVNPSSLAPLEVGTATATYTVIQADLNAGKAVNTATVTGTSPTNQVATDVSDNGDEFLDTPEDADTDPTNDPTVVPLPLKTTIKLVKTASLFGTGSIGNVVVYTFTVTNTGNAPLTAVSISDPKLGLSTLAVIPSTLAPNAIGTATATYTITQADINVGKLVNTATVTGTAPSGPPVTDVSDSGNEFVDTPEDADADPTNDPTVVPLLQSPAIKLVKMASLSGAGVIGDKITYTFTVTNTGNVPLTAVNIADAKLGLTALVVTPNNLAPNAIGKATATYTITQADIDAGEMKNTATVKGTAPNGISVTDVSDSGDEFLDTTADPDSDPTNDPTVVIFPRMPRFTETSAICSGTTLTALPTTSSNGIIGTWSPALNNTMTTTYTFTPSIGQNAAISTMTITVYAEPSFTLAQTNVTCGGSANGTITVTPTGGQSPFEFSKDDAATFPNINGIFSNLGPGTYKIAIKDANGCIKKCN